MDQNLILLLAASALVALLVGWLIGRAAGRRSALFDRVAELAEKDSAYQILQNEHTHKSQLLATLQQKQAGLERIQAGHEAELNQWKEQAQSNAAKWDVANRNNSLVTNEFQAYKAATNNQLNELSRINQGLEAHLKATRDDMLSRDAKLAAFAQENTGLKNALEASQHQLAQLQAATAEQYAALKGVYDELLAEKQTLLADVSKHQSEIALLHQQQSEAQAQADQLQETAQAQITALQESAAQLESRLLSKAEELAERGTELENLAAEHRELEENYAFLQEEESLAIQNLESLEVEYTAVATDLQRLKTTMGMRMRERRDFIAANHDLLERNDRLLSKLETLNGRYQMEIGSTLDDLEAYKQRISQMNAELQNNRVAIANLEAENQRLRQNGTAAIAVAPTSLKEPEDAILERIRNRARQLDFDRIGTASPDERDDLEALKGLGPFTVRLVNALGIYTYRQLAALNETDVDVVNDAIEFIPGRIRRDDWVGQAKQRLGVRGEEVKGDEVRGDEVRGDEVKGEEVRGRKKGNGGNSQKKVSL